MSPTREIWVLPEIDGSEISELGQGLLSEACEIAAAVGGTATALVFTDGNEDYAGILGQYGISRAYIYRHPLLKHFSAEACAAALAERLLEEKPWLCLMGDTTIGRELGPRLAWLLGTGLVSGCVRMEADPGHPRFFRPVYGAQAYQEIIFTSGATMVVTLDPRILNINILPSPVEARIEVITPELSPENIRTRHLGYAPADFRAVDVAEADVIVGAGVGAATDALLPLVKELAELVEGAIGTTRPVVDEGKIGRERLIGQTGKVVSPDLYLALGISGATHHLGGVQGSGTIVSVNRDAGAPIFQSSDVGVVADLKEILPGLIEKIRQARQDGKII